MRNRSEDEVETPFEKLFSCKTVELMRVNRVVEWFKSKDLGKLRLPPIQRNFIWRNEQILNYWDSLLRDYPAGTMLVARGGRYGRDLQGKTHELGDTDFQLFDGQQRLNTLLLGLDQGPQRGSLRIWVDLGTPAGSGDRLYELRINSVGQPFGYQVTAPNEKLAARDRRDVHEAWPLKADGTAQPPDVIFDEISKQPIGRLSSAKCAISLAFILEQLQNTKKETTAYRLRTMTRGKLGAAGDADIDDLLNRLQSVLDAEIIVKCVNGAALDEENYARFFARLGQGGTRLTDDELTYSLIKNLYPKVHDCVEDIVNELGRFASEVDLVLGALRVAQILAPWPGAADWEKAARPTPGRLKRINDIGKHTTEACFRSMILEEDNTSFGLKAAITSLLEGLRYEVMKNSLGLPYMLLGRLPRELLDVLLLLTFKRNQTTWSGADRSTLIAFVLHWLIFVKDDRKAADHVFRMVSDGSNSIDLSNENWSYGEHSIARLIHRLETEGVARRAPRAGDWPRLLEQVEQRVSRLATWTERFSELDADVGGGPGESIRVWSTHRELIRRSLIWLQRRYITQVFPHYNPTSTHDDDLPFDLDHAIPWSLYGDDWRRVRKRFDDSYPYREQFDTSRHSVGNSLGNFRWLAAADNRRRGKGLIEDDRYDDLNRPPIDDYIVDRSSWNQLIETMETRKWGEDDVTIFQRLIDDRTLRLARIFMDDSGIATLIKAVDDMNALSNPSTSSSR